MFRKGSHRKTIILTEKKTNFKTKNNGIKYINILNAIIINKNNNEKHLCSVSS